MTFAETHQAVPRWHWWMLVLILLLAASLRLFNLSVLGFWCDELCSLSDAAGHGLQLAQVPMNRIVPAGTSYTGLKEADSFWKIPAGIARDDTHPPLYFMLLRLWEDALGNSESAVRCLSVISSLLAIFLLYIAARDAVGSATALVACGLMTVATPQIQYAQEARNYMPVMPMALTAYIAITRLTRSVSVVWATVLTLGVLAMMLTHYFSVALIAALFLCAVLCLRGRARVYALSAMVFAGFVFALAWGSVVLSQQARRHGELSWLADDSPGWQMRRLTDLCQLPVRFFYEPTTLSPAITVAGGMMLCGVPLLFARRAELRTWIIWLVCTLGLVTASDLGRSTTFLHWTRYALFATPAVYVLLAGALRGRWRFVLPAMAVVAALTSLPQAYAPSWKIDFRALSRIYEKGKLPGDLLVFCGDYPAIDAILLESFRRDSEHGLPDVAVITAPPVGPTLAVMRQYRRVWIVWLGNDRHMPGFATNQKFELPAESIEVGAFAP